MPKRSFKQNQRGFTLLEIMLVVVVLGMVSVAVVMTLPSSLIAGDSAKWQAERFSNILQFAEDEALISGNELGIEFSERGYQFAFYDRQNKRWIPIDVPEMQQNIELPESINMEYNLVNSVWEELSTNNNSRFIDDSYRVAIGEEQQQTLNPQVYVMSSGEVSPFSVIFSNSDSDSSVDSFTVEVTMNGEIEISQPEP